MKGALIILLALVVTGVVLYLFHRRDVRRGTDQAPTMGPMPDRVQDEDGDDSAHAAACMSPARKTRSWLLSATR